MVIASVPIVGNIVLRINKSKDWPILDFVINVNYVGKP
jgi:hypothetical protein